MGKSIRCKVKKRFRTVKRQCYEQALGNDKLQRISQKLTTTPGIHDPEDIPTKNAFLYPNDPAASFPQYQKPTLVDFRSNNIDFAGYEFRGSSRKNKIEETKNETMDEDMNEVPANEEDAGGDDDMIELNEDDLMADFRNMGIAGATKKIKKKKFGDMQTESSGFIGFNAKKKMKEKNKNKGGCRKSRKIMKW